MGMQATQTIFRHGTYNTDMRKEYREHELVEIAYIYKNLVSMMHRLDLSDTFCVAASINVGGIWIEVESDGWYSIRR